MQQSKTIVFKYGGNAMTDDRMMRKLAIEMTALVDRGHRIVIVHGGGPFIRQALEEAEIESEFIDGQRKTSVQALKYVEMALKGNVNGSLVSLINSLGYKAVGLSGKDGKMISAKKRMHQSQVNGRPTAVDLGRVGDVETVDPYLLWLLLEHGYIPVIACLASDDKGKDYNINGDLFAGHIAGAMMADEFIIFTDVDGLLLDISDSTSLISELKLDEVRHLIDDGTIQGGMLPKVDACEKALIGGARHAVILNGTKPEQLSRAVNNEHIGTGFIL